MKLRAPLKYCEAAAVLCTKMVELRLSVWIRLIAQPLTNWPHFLLPLFHNSFFIPFCFICCVFSWLFFQLIEFSQSSIQQVFESTRSLSPPKDCVLKTSGNQKNMWNQKETHNFRTSQKTKCVFFLQKQQVNNSQQSLQSHRRALFQTRATALHQRLPVPERGTVFGILRNPKGTAAA